MDTFTPTTNANAIPTVIAQETLKLLPAYFGVARFVSKDTDWTGEDFASYGDTLDITRPGELVAKTKTAGGVIETQNPDTSKVSVSLDTHAYVSFLQEDITKMLQKPNLQNDYARNAAIKLAEKVETSIYGLHPNVTNVVTWDATSATTIDASLRAVRSKFARLKVPVNEQKVFFGDTSVIDDILSVDKYQNNQYMGEDGLTAMGVIKKIYNTNIAESQLVQTSGSPVAYHNLALTKYGVVLVNRPMPLDGNGRGAVQTIMVDPDSGIAMRMTESYDTSYMGVKITLDLLFGVAIADANQIIEVESF